MKDSPQSEDSLSRPTQSSWVLPEAPVGTLRWDGRDRPAIEAPLGDFFANSFVIRSEVISLPVVVEDADSYNCYWCMPFQTLARIEIVNESDKPLRGLHDAIDLISRRPYAPAVAGVPPLLLKGGHPPKVAPV